MKGVVKISRRDFIVAGAAGGVGLLLGVQLDARRSRRRSRAEGQQAPFQPNVWIEVAPSGGVTIWVAKSEMGQGVWASLPAIVADEMDADWERIRIRQADADPAYGSQWTAGSTSVSTSWEELRRAGAAAREMLIAAAASAWGVPATSCRTENGAVVHPPSGRRAGYGELAARAAAVRVPQRPRLKSPDEYRLVGKRFPRPDIPAKVDGTAVFGLDVRVAGLLVAVIARPPAFGGRVRRFDASRARSLPGVRGVTQLEPITTTLPVAIRVPGGVAVVADSTWSALQAREALEIEWDDGPNAGLTSEGIDQLFQRGLGNTGEDIQRRGDADAALRRAPITREATYRVPFLAHTLPEPPNAIADVHQDRCEVWASTQDPVAAQRAIASILRLRPDAVTVHVPFLGGGFGRCLETDMPVEAALVSRAVGAPVQVFWTREDDVRHGFYRPAALHRMRAGLNAAGALIAWQHRIVGPTVASQREPGNRNKAGEYHYGGSVVRYAVADVLTDYVRADSAVPLGWWRSVESSSTIFAIESFVDELALAAKLDPVAFRLQLLDRQPRLQAVLQLAAQHAQWGRTLSPGQGRGVAVCIKGGTSIAQIADVAVAPDGTVRVPRVVCAVDCGTVVNPDQVEAQMEGGITFGASAALLNEITLAAGRVTQGNWQDYPVLRMNEAPAVEVHIVPSSERPSGVGEAPVPPIAPAITNAIFAATGKRVRTLPIGKVDTRGGGQDDPLTSHARQ